MLSVVLDLLSMATCGMPLVGEVLDALISRLSSEARKYGVRNELALQNLKLP